MWCSPGERADGNAERSVRFTRMQAGSGGRHVLRVYPALTKSFKIDCDSQDALHTKIAEQLLKLPDERFIDFCASSPDVAISLGDEQLILKIVDAVLGDGDCLQLL